MESQNLVEAHNTKKLVQQFAQKQWARLGERQQNYAKRVWGVMTYKWRWQIAMNIPYLAIFLLDRSVPAVHEFDMNLLQTITTKIPIPAFISSWIGFS